MKPAKVVDIVRAIPAREVRSTVINWPRMVETVIDGYRSHRGLVHGVQKDGIQNGWDARVDRRRGKNWSYSFKLVMSKKRGAHSFLVLQDQGTYGLTGRVLRPTSWKQISLRRSGRVGLRTLPSTGIAL